MRNREGHARGDAKSLVALAVVSAAVLLTGLLETLLSTVAIIVRDLWKSIGTHGASAGSVIGRSIKGTRTCDETD